MDPAKSSSDSDSGTSSSWALADDNESENDIHGFKENIDEVDLEHFNPKKIEEDSKRKSVIDDEINVTEDAPEKDDTTHNFSEMWDNVYFDKLIILLWILTSLTIPVLLHYFLTYPKNVFVNAGTIISNKELIQILKSTRSQIEAATVSTTKLTTALSSTSTNIDSDTESTDIAKFQETNSDNYEDDYENNEKSEEKRKDDGFYYDERDEHKGKNVNKINHRRMNDGPDDLQNGYKDEPENKGGHNKIRQEFQYTDDIQDITDYYEKVRNLHRLLQNKDRDIQRMMKILKQKNMKLKTLERKIVDEINTLRKSKRNMKSYSDKITVPITDFLYKVYRGGNKFRSRQHLWDWLFLRANVENKGPSKKISGQMTS